VWGFQVLGHGFREYHIALSEALREAAVASVSEWLRLFSLSPAAGQHPKCRAAGSDQDPPAQRLAAGDPKPRGWQRLGHPAQWVQSGSGWS